MRLVLSSIFCLIFYSSSAQLLDPTVEWFELNDFFNEQLIKDRAITHLKIDVSSKADGKIIKDKGEKLSYAFNASGLLIKAEKRIPMHRGYDTATVELKYDDQRRLSRKLERHGPYHYTYAYLYKSDSTFRSLKLMLTKNGFDTLYHRYHQIKRSDRQEIEKVANKKGLVFMIIKRKYNEGGKLEVEELEYVFSKNQSRTKYYYVEGKLIQKHYRMDYGQRSNSLREYSYQNGLLEEIRFSEREKLSKRMTFAYSGDLPSAAVVRIVAEKEIKIYRFNYTFY